MKEPLSVRLGMWVHCGLACLFGCLAWAYYPPTTNSREQLLAALIAGFGGSWLAMFCYVWARFGWSAARSMRMDPSA